VGVLLSVSFVCLLLSVCFVCYCVLLSVIYWPGIADRFPSPPNRAIA
jgi:hypothetical protein